MEYLSLRSWLSVYHCLYFVFSVFVDTDCNKHRQTSRPVARAQIQTSCNFEENVSRCSCILGCAYRRHNNVLLKSTYFFMVRQHRSTTVPSHLNFFLHKFFLTYRRNQNQVQSHAFQGQPSQAIPLNIARYRKAVSTALWVQVTLVVCYLLSTRFFDGWRHIWWRKRTTENEAKPVIDLICSVQMMMIFWSILAALFKGPDTWWNNKIFWRCHTMQFVARNVAKLELDIFFCNCCAQRCEKSSPCPGLKDFYFRPPFWKRRRPWGRGCLMSDVTAITHQERLVLRTRPNL